ncbi:sensor histidine kinase [Nonomuraea africana]|uniref:histidine kinase n=1 Tax=Nonomuraea africana TaxID=46171 RepID=A0ABR9KMV3_9ACTN|nr:histidine kinase [Nonomuraea africana]MBE1563344.1 signal transduction histidine kinase [Nonomuraea africana]
MVLGVLVFGLSLATVSGQMGVVANLPFPLLVLIAAVAGAAAWFAPRAWWPLAAVGVLAYVGLAMWPPLLVASYYAGTTLRERRGVAAYAGMGAVVVVLSAAAGVLIGGPREHMTGTFGNATVMGAALIGLPLVFGLWVRARRDVLAAAHERAERLEREQVMRAEQARVQERARIAREMHDIVAHRVSLMVMHAGALEVGSADTRTAETAALIGDIGREALTNLRDVLGVLRSTTQPAPRAPQPTLADLDELLDRSRALGIALTRRDEGEARSLGPTVERTAYRVVQEALTNVHKHAGETSADVSLRFLPSSLEVVVANQSPVRPAAPLPESGWGLVGLRERVELVGGTLHTGYREDGGFELRARIPA